MFRMSLKGQSHHIVRDTFFRIIL